MTRIEPELLAVLLPEARGHLEVLTHGEPGARVEAARGLKGACAMVGLDELCAAAEHVEQLLRRGDPAQAEIAQLSEQVAALEAAPAAASESEWDPEELRGLRAFFLDEAAEHLDAIHRGLAALHADPADRQALGQVLRKLHTFKGSAGSVELHSLTRAAHALEDRLIALREAARPVGVDDLTALELDIDSLALDVQTIDREVRGRVSEPSWPGTLPSSDALPRVGPPAEPLPPAPTERRVEAGVATVRVEVERIDELMDAASELVFDRTRMYRRTQELEGCVRDLAKVRGALHGALPELDGALRRAPELLARFSEIATELDSAVAQLSRAVQGAEEDVEGLQRSSKTLQEGIRRVRMMAVGRLFARLEQPLRELARRVGKQVRVVTAGEETEIDKAVVERVAEPLLHLVRNAVAHGIESPEARRAAGKPAAGEITLTARHQGDAVEIVVADDGQGIDLDAVRRALVIARRVGASEAAALDEATLYASLFEPGLSTRMVADGLAGRGVGLDAVKEAITRLGGTVRVTSTPGRGATFIVALPLTTAVQQALLFKVGGQVYAIPAARVKEALEVTTGDLKLEPGSERLIVPGTGAELPLVRLGALLGVPAPPGTARRAALIVTVGDQTFAMTCDKVIGPREIVVRSLGPLLAGLPAYAGATISGGGKVQLILDVEYLAEHAQTGVKHARPTRALGPRRVLVVDDSRAIRETAQLILAQGGYAAETVPDGWDAWELLQDRPFDLLVTDLEMPRLDGHELLAKVRSSPELKGLPVVIVSSRTADTTRARVREAGADGFVPKPLRRKALLDEVELALGRRRAT